MIKVIRKNYNLPFTFGYVKENLYRLSKDKLFAGLVNRNTMCRILPGTAFIS